MYKGDRILISRYYSTTGTFGQKPFSDSTVTDQKQEFTTSHYHRVFSFKIQNLCCFFKDFLVSSVAICFFIGLTEVNPARC